MSEQEPEVDETAEEVSGAPGQIVFPEPEVDAERAAAFAAGKVETLEPEEEEADADE